MSDTIHEVSASVRSPIVAVCAFGVLVLHGTYALVRPPQAPPVPEMIRIEEKLDVAAELQEEQRRMIAALTAP